MKAAPCPTLVITAQLLADCARILDEAAVPSKDRLVWDGEKFASDNAELAAKANGDGA